MNRSNRQNIAEETLKIIENGCYKSFSTGKEIDISENIKYMIENTRLYKPEELIGQRYKGGTFDMNAFGDMCEDAFLFQPLSYYGLDNTLKDHRISNSVAFQLPQLDMTASKKSIKETKKEVEAQY